MKVKNPAISVLLCTHNDAPFVAEAIQSIIDQSFDDFEFIIINDSSTDETENVIHSFSDTRIVYLKNEQNQGLGYSKNRGIKVARGKYIVYQDGDDISEPNRLQIQFDFMEKHPEKGVCSSAISYLGERSDSYYPSENEEELRTVVLFGMPMPHPACMVRMSVLEQYQIRYPHDFDAAEDHPFMVDLMTKSRVHCIQQPLYRYRKHALNISMTKREIQLKNSARAGRIAFEKLLGLDINEAERQAAKKVLYKRPTKKEMQLFEPLLMKIKMEVNEKDFKKDFKQFFVKKGREKLSYHRRHPISRLLNLFR